MARKRTRYIHEPCSLERPLHTGNWRLEGPGTVGTHLHDTVEILWSSRPMIVTTEQQRVRLRPGVMQLVAPGVLHTVKAVGPAALPGELPGSHLALDEANLGQTAVTWRTTIISAQHARVIKPLVLYLVDRLKTTDRTISNDLRLIACGLLGLLRDLGYADSRVPQNIPGPVRKALDLVERRGLDPQLDVRQLASSAGLSPVHFRRIFQQVTNKSPKAYLSAHRLERARYALVAGKKTVAAIAQESGFASVSALYRSYKIHYGRSPGQETTVQ